MNTINIKAWLISWLIIVISMLCIIGGVVYKVDPFFHFHYPEVDKYFYTLSNQRGQNDGICKHFDYDALITGTSMVENFRTSEADDLYGHRFVKVPFSGGSFAEINDNIERSLNSNPNLKLVIRCLDTSLFIYPGNRLLGANGVCPYYLYDENPFNDVEYLFNRDILFYRVYQMELDTKSYGFNSGITSFDDYSRWQERVSFGISNVCPGGITVSENVTECVQLTDSEKKMIDDNINQNVTSIAELYPDVDFYYYYPPYSIITWNLWRNERKLYKYLEAEAYITERIVSHDNIHLFSFNNRTDITTDLNNYKDDSHYASWINSLILKWMRDDQYRLTENNFKEYLKEEYDFYTTFDYESINDQNDYEADYYAAALLNKELTGVEPLDVLNNDKAEVNLNGAELILDKYNKKIGISCQGLLVENQADLLPSFIDMKYNDASGVRISVNLDDGYNYLCFNGMKTGQGCLTVYIFDEYDEPVGAEFVDDYLDSAVHQYVVDVSSISGTITIILNGANNIGNDDSIYQFTNIFLY